ncbi:hypothetical protein BH11ARM1_BH11ARM1_07090 [soil metagenome]
MKSSRAWCSMLTLTAAIIHAAWWRFYGGQGLLGLLVPEPRINQALWAGALVQLALIIVFVFAAKKELSWKMAVGSLLVIVAISAYSAFWIKEVVADLA